MKTIFTFLFLAFSIAAFAQQTISGKVTDEKGHPIAGANIFIEGTYDGDSSDEQGNFSFQTTAAGKQNLVVTFLTYETLNQEIAV